ncbi:MAG: HAD-IB family phosphatase [Gammaproteobacteria bacterium]|nr:HAD-IB family phosphatase [Gammaproteobacteria bacterium]
MRDPGAASLAPAGRPAAAAKLALFDLDGTLTRHDTLIAYLAGFLRHRRPARTLRLLQVLPVLASFSLGRADRGVLKSAAIRAVIGGCTRIEIEGWTGEFVPHLLAHGMHAAALAALERHRHAGDLLVLLSASPDLYVPAIGHALGFVQTICTGIEWKGDRLDGHLTTPNRRDAEKVRCVEELRRQHPGLALTAYANAASDLDHLALADRGILVNGSAVARSAAARLDIDCVTWR